MLATAGTSVASAQMSQLSSHQRLPAAIAKFTPPEIEKPEWYQQQEAAEQAAQQSTARSGGAQTPTSGARVVTYTISTKGATGSDLGQFSAQVNETLNHSRGWAQLGVSFQQVPSGGNFNLVLSEASLLPTFSSGCSAEWSCRVGVSVIINDLRWSGASEAWRASGGSLRDYQHMVVNHEVGHWLGHGHLHCPGPGQPAPVMQQQSIDLQGCQFNPWPLPSELWSSQLGIR